MERLSIEEVSKIIGQSPHEIRYKCRYDMYQPPICRTVRKKGGKQNRYLFFKELVNAYVGKQDPVQGMRKKTPSVSR